MKTINELIEQNALFVINHSGGKDSQAMFLKLRDMVPASQILIIHVDLPGADWAGTWDHVVDTTAPFVPMKTRAVKTFLEMVQTSHDKLVRQVADPDHDRVDMVSAWPSPSQRQCTSDLKRGPIEREIRRHLKAHPQYNGLIVNCMGMRAQESTSRSKLETLKYSARNSKAGREWYDWLPIHDMLEDEVFDTIKAAGQEAHWAYGEGMSRLSCMFCIMASPDDLRISAQLNPETYARYVEMEEDLGFTMMMPTGGVAQALEKITGIKARR